MTGDRKTILITGCSSGIGYAAAHGLHKRGWKVVASCRQQKDVERLRTEGLASVRIDYEDEHSIATGYEDALSLLGGRLDALFNNGAYAVPGAVGDLPTDALRTIFEANFFGWHSLTKRAYETMWHQGEAGAGRIVQCSSVLGFVGMPFRVSYVSTKYALEGYTDVLRQETKFFKRDIDIILIEPGPITTDIRKNARIPYQKWVKPIIRDSVRTEFYAKMEKRLYSDNIDRFELPPEAVLKKLIHALEAPRPRARYFVTYPTYISNILRRVLSTKALDKMLMD